ncbi:MAG: MgtC/SapB family protein [Acidimicrobiia bacterium]
MDVGVILVNLLVAAGLSGLIGLERELRHQDAGLRTHMMIGLGAAVFTIAGVELGADRTRVAAQIVSGIGFLGAGAIFRAGDNIKGLTTAAGMWTVAGIGVAAGFGLLDLAVLATVVALVILYGLLPVVDRISKNTNNDEGRGKHSDPKN